MVNCSKLPLHFRRNFVAYLRTFLLGNLRSVAVRLRLYEEIDEFATNKS